MVHTRYEILRRKKWTRKDKDTLRVDAPLQINRAPVLSAVGAAAHPGDSAHHQQPQEQAADRRRNLKAFKKGGGGGEAAGGGEDGWGRFDGEHVWEFVGGANDVGRGDGVLEVDALIDAIFVRGDGVGVVWAFFVVSRLPSWLLFGTVSTAFFLHFITPCLCRRHVLCRRCVS